MIRLYLSYLTDLIGLILLLLVTSIAPQNTSFLDAYKPVWTDFADLAIYDWTAIPIIFSFLALFFISSTNWKSIALQLLGVGWISLMWQLNFNKYNISATIVAPYLLAGVFLIFSSALTLTTKYKNLIPG